jgi:hypothetical protein
MLQQFGTGACGCNEAVCVLVEERSISTCQLGSVDGVGQPTALLSSCFLG